MVICFKCSRQTKEQLDELVRTGGFADISEAVSVAIANQTLLTQSAGNSTLVLGNASTHPQATERTGPTLLTVLEPSTSPKPRIPSLFQRPSQDWRCEPVAGIPDTNRAFSLDENISQAQWIFGQHNKLLPAKASCRALANLLADAPAGIDPQEGARLIANSAAEIGAFLSGIDSKYGRQRDDMLSTAFPGRAEPDKGRIRYANQFVVGVTKQGELTGLLFDLRLINKLPNRKIALTEAGWQFAQMQSPVLDVGDENPQAKLSDEERKFLARHIASKVPIERSAYVQILSAVHNGHDNPEKLRAAFQELENETEANRLYFATQRAGAISRMVDVGLLRRDRSGTRVTYAITDNGIEFLNA